MNEGSTTYSRDYSITFFQQNSFSKVGRYLKNGCSKFYIMELYLAPLNKFKKSEKIRKLTLTRKYGSQNFENKM